MTRRTHIGRQRFHSPGRSRSSFSRHSRSVELLVVIAIIGILVALLAAGDSSGARSGPSVAMPEQS